MFYATNPKLKIAVNFATQKHRGQKRWGGEPFISHPIAVADYLYKRGYGEETLLAALFHDLLEDTDTTENEILERSNALVLKTVILLTKPLKYDMKIYLEAINHVEMAKTVKCADRIHNLRTTRKGSRAFQKKYYDESVVWYKPFFKNTIFEPDFLEALLELERLIEPNDEKEKLFCQSKKPINRFS
ncbi:MAG: HD domain-containing protein [Eubacterium sp.]